MKPNKEIIYDFIRLHTANELQQGVSTQYIADVLNLQRTNVSSILGRLVDEGKISKTNGRPVLYSVSKETEEPEKTCFQGLIGADGSLKRAVQLAKAAILYPQKSLNVILIGEKGTGKSFLVYLMFQYANQCGVISSASKMITFNCRDHIGDDASVLQKLYGTKDVKGIIQNAKGGMLYIDQAQYLSTQTRRYLSTHLEGDGPVVIISCDNSNGKVSQDFTPEIPVSIELPNLSSRPLRERLEMIQSFLTLEAARIKRKIVIKEELLRCLLLYDCEANCMQLKADIKIGCANAYVREYKSKEQLQLFISDFEHYVRKGFLKYQSHRQEIEELIPSNYNYCFSDKSCEMSVQDKEKLKGSTIYDEINRKVSSLNASGLEEAEINLLLSTELEMTFQKYQNTLVKEIANKEQLAILVEKPIIRLVEEFLEEAQKQLGRKHANSVFYGLCLHIQSLIRKHPQANPIIHEQISNILKNHKAEYLLSLELAKRVEQLYQVELQVEDIILITLFISDQTSIADTTNKPVILFAFYGTDVAESIKKTIIQLTQLELVYAFELVFEKDTEEIYTSLKNYIEKIHRGKGVLVCFDSSFLSDMLNSIQEELNIVIRQIICPIITMGTELVRSAALEEDMDVVYQNVAKVVGERVLPLKKTIVALCTTGKGGAEELKRYIELYGKVEDMDVVALALSDRTAIKEELAELMKQSSIQCVVGTYDPKLFSLPFLSVSEVFGVPKEQLPSVLRHNRIVKKEIDYEAVFDYLEEQLEHTQMARLKKILPGVLAEMNETICQLSTDSEIGLFIHISCCIDRMLGELPLPVNLRKEMILSKYNGQYRKLLKIVKPLEKAFHIIFNEDELANILTIIYQL